MAEKLNTGKVTSLSDRKAREAAKLADAEKHGDRPVIIAAPAPAAGIGDNLTPEQEARALRIHHVSNLRAQMNKVDAAKVDYDAERQILTDLYHLAKADTKIHRKDFAALLVAMKKSRAEIEAEEKQRAELWGDWDLPVGYQGDLFENMPKEAADEQHAKGMGYAAGLRGDPCQMPEGMAVRFGQAFGDGWGKGQEELAWALSAVGRIVDRKKGAQGGPTREEIARQPEEPDDEAKIAAAAKKLKAEGFTEKSDTAAGEFA